MNVLIVNPIVYTSETKNIVRAKSIKDTMIYDLCLAFQSNGHGVTLYAAEPFKPTEVEEYPFDVVWAECRMKNLCLPHCFPYMPGLRKYINLNKENIDLIICSEVFSLNTLTAVQVANKKVIVWHELAKHNAKMKKIPSKLWYNIIPRVFMRNTQVVARSEEARKFISQYCRMTADFVIDHGVNLDKFRVNTIKDNYFVVCSQLIARKRISGILEKFSEYLKNIDKQAKLYIIGDGDERLELENKSAKLEITDSVIFTGKMNHEQLMPYLAGAKALLINTEKDNNMISIVEAIAVGTPIVTTDVPLNAAYIKKYKLGIAKDWAVEDLIEVVQNNDMYVNNCLGYRELLSTKTKAKQFMELI